MNDIQPTRPHHGDASVAKDTSDVPGVSAQSKDKTTTPINGTNDTDDTPDNGDAMTTPGVSIVKPPETEPRDLATSASPQMEFADGLVYNLTLKQVPEILQEANREVPSSRTLQRICSEGNSVLKCRKIKTVYGQEWLVNKDSLYEYIDAQPIKLLDENTTNDTPVIGDASVAITTTANVSVESERENTPAVQANDTPADGVASVAEDRTLAEVLIENARLVATAETKDELIGELREDKDFLRETVREDRKHRGEVKGIADKMLETMRDMALGNRLRRGED